MKAVFVGVDARASELASLSFRLRWPNAEFLASSTGRAGLELIEQESPDVVLMHPDFTDMTLNSVIQELRGFSNVPLLVMGHHPDEMEVVTSLETGADDYVRLPCELTELMVRIWALLRRAGLKLNLGGEGPMASGRLLINPATYEVFLDRKRITLTSTEFRLLHLLVKSNGTVVARRTLEQTLWGDDVDSYGLIKKYVQRLRKKIGDNARDPVWIASIHGVGYRFIGPDTTSVGTESLSTK